MAISQTQTKKKDHKTLANDKLFQKTVNIRAKRNKKASFRDIFVFSFKF